MTYKVRLIDRRVDEDVVVVYGPYKTKAGALAKVRALKKWSRTWWGGRHRISVFSEDRPTTYYREWRASEEAPIATYSIG